MKLGAFIESRKKCVKFRIQEECRKRIRQNHTKDLGSLTTGENIGKINKQKTQNKSQKDSLASNERTQSERLKFYAANPCGKIAAKKVQSSSSNKHLPLIFNRL